MKIEKKMEEEVAYGEASNFSKASTGAPTGAPAGENMSSDKKQGSNKKIFGKIRKFSVFSDTYIIEQKNLKYNY